jgi:hypoxanthine phosphoribosyltransferase
MTELPMSVVLSPEQIQARGRELGRQISLDLGDQPVLIGVLKGAFVFMGDLARAMTVPVQVDFLRVASYGGGSVSSGCIQLTKAPELDLKGRAVVLVEDIVDTGRTVAWLKEHVASLGPSQVKVCSLIDKPERREVELSIDYVGFHVPQGFLVGYGLDFNENYRHLPGVYEIQVSH